MQPLEFRYKNHRGETSQRRVKPLRIYWGNTEYHPDSQWLLEAFDEDKKALRDFAMADINPPEEVNK